MNDQPFDNTDAKAHRVAYLVAGYIRKTLTRQEHDELDAWVEASDENMRMFEELTDEKNIEANLQWMDRVNTEEQLKSVKQGLVFNKPAVKARSTRLWSYSIAAALILVAAGIFIVRQMASKQTSDASTASQAVILPQKNTSTITLSDGSIVELSKIDNGALRDSSGARKAGDQLVYSGAGSNEVQFHTLTTSVGGQFSIQLSDGSRVWLNATSSMKYPTTFVGTERIVELSGEGYFEIAKDATRPFKVKMADNTTVTVLGTHFNISDYTSEVPREITLLEGSVAVTKGDQKRTLQPGEQLQIQDGNMQLVKGVDTEEVTGWKDGQFVFKDADIKRIMQQVMRWYDVQVVYQDNVAHLFNASISRKEDLSKLLHLLELTGKIHFKVQNKTIYVLQ